MKLVASIRTFASALFHRARVEREIDEELRAHIENRAADLERSGLPRAEAERRARVEFGGYEAAKEECRDALGISFLESLLGDIRFGLRMLRKSPGLTVFAVLTLALGIGANTAIFSVADGVLLRALHYAEPEQLYAIREVVPQFISFMASMPVNGGNFLAWRREARAFSGMTLTESVGGSLLGTGRPQWLYGAAVTSDFFRVLGVRPMMGRAFSVGAGASGGKPEIILTDNLWREQFHSDPAVLGKIVNLNGRALTIAGVMPAGFVFPHILSHTPEYLVPFPWTASDSKPGLGSHNYAAIARLGQGVSAREAGAQLDVIEARIAKQASNGKFGMYATLTPLRTEIVGPTRNALWLLMLAACLVLLIVCANLANLLLAKNTQRMREVALRAAFGASRWRLARQFLTEALLLATSGACLGLIVAKAGLWFLVKNAPVGIPRVNEIHLDSTALWFTLAATILATAFFGLLPALRISRVEPGVALKRAGPAPSTGGPMGRLRGGLVIGQVALCAALLPCCLLLMESLRHVVLANQWMNEEHVVTASLFVPSAQTHTRGEVLKVFVQRNEIFDAIRQRVAQLPGVESAGFTSSPPLEGVNWGDDIRFEEIPWTETEKPLGEFRFVSPGYFQAIGLPLIQGRFLSEGDRGKSVALISETVARKIVGARDPLGMHIYCGHFSYTSQNWCRVIGVVSDVRDESDRAPILAAYFPAWISSTATETLVVRTRMDASAAAGAIRQAVWSVDPQLAVPQVKTLKTILASSEAPRGYETWLVALFAFGAFLLAMLGLYAVISFSVNQRMHELGIRMAMGAQPADVLRMVIRDGAILAGAGIVIGVGGALALTRLLQSFLFEISPTDPVTFAGVAIALALVGLLACYIPARRAARLDPMTVLRQE
jgi:predicted permease